MGCDTCGHDGMIEGHIVPGHDHGSVLEEKWDPLPTPKPAPGKTLHKADSPHSVKVGAAPRSPRSSGRMAYVEPAPSGAR